MDSWIELGRGPLFRLAFSLMILGLLRIVLNTVQDISEAYRRNPDKIVPWKAILWQTLAWLFPAGRLWRRRPVYSTISFLFHVGLLTVPFFLAAHVLLWRAAVGFAWPALPQKAADWLTLMVISTGAALLAARVADRRMRALSRTQDYFWPLLLVIPFASGYPMSHAALSPSAYRQLILVHVYSAALIMLLMPFTKIAHCVLAPLSHAVTAVAWKFVPGAGDRVAATLGYGECPCWMEKARAVDAAPLPREVIAK